MYTRVYPRCRRCGTREEVSWHSQPAHRSWPRATCVGVQRVIAMSAVIYEAIILVCRCRDREGCLPLALSLLFLLPSSLPLSLSIYLYLFHLSSNPPLTRGMERTRGEDFVVAHTDLPRARALIGLPHYFTTDSGLKGLSAVVRMGGRWYSSCYRDIKSVRYEDYPSSNELDSTAASSVPRETPL